MNFSEKIHALRRSRGLSQEQLAENLNVSRQAISKWESGHAIPEAEKLLVISEYFEVSLDYLMKDSQMMNSSLKEAEVDAQSVFQQSGKSTLPATEHSTQAAKSAPSIAPGILPGIVICVAGIVCLIIWGMLSVFNPNASTQISQSSMIQLDGNGIFLIICIVAIVVGAWLLVKNLRQN